jgi:LmbE family N-acetylglucosaminyl deacetylase
MLLRISLALFLFLHAAAWAQYRPEAGSLRVKHGLEKLQRLGSVLMIAAHPDDENTALLAYLAKSRKMRTAYLSLTRGEGGQNLIGSEQGPLMGLIRTQELMAARRVDGAEQFFTRAIDFGFSKTAEETLAKWGHESVLSDVVWVIRRFRPDVVLLRFSGTPRDGHGHHQSSAILGKEAFSVAADPKRFPEQLKYVQPWQATRLYWNVFAFNRQMEQEADAMPNRIAMDVGAYDPELGLSYGEIAGISRSQHRSQGMGAAERKGSIPQHLTWVAGDKATTDLFDGVDTTWSRVPGGGAEVGASLAAAARVFRIDQPEASVPALLAARRLIAALARQNALAAQKLLEVDEVIADAACLWLDASAQQQISTAGSAMKLQISAVNRSRAPASLAGISVTGGVALNEARPLEFNKPLQFAYEVPLPAGALNQPFWLRSPPGETMYKIDNPQLIGVPDLGSGYQARFRVSLGGEVIEVERPVVNRYVDPVRGELTRPIIVAPPVAVGFAERSLVFPSAAARGVEVQVRANLPKAAGDLRIEAPAGWRVEPALRTFSVEDLGGVATVQFTITPPARESSGELRAVARINGVEVRHDMRIIDYEHIPAQTVFNESRAAVVRVDARVLARRVGYVMGAGDDVPAALRQLGVEVIPLSGDDLARADLSGFDAIVTGVRAYNVRKDLRSSQPRLLEYVDHGGTLIVQYNVAPGGFGGGNPRLLDKIGPYPMQVSSDRVTVETAPLKPTKPDQFLLQAPNRIVESDYQGWVQERGLYFARTWDAHYTPLWETNDPGEKTSQGATLYTRYGKGIYIFTPMAWFRQLPAGVPGAYRLFANFLSAGKVSR